MKRLLTHPLTSELDIDDPRVTQRRRQMIQEKGFLRQIYQEWYSTVAAALPAINGPVLELGSGGGFLKEFIPGLCTSELFCCLGINVVLDGLELPFANGALQGIVMTNVFHHLHQPRRFLAECSPVYTAGRHCGDD